MKKKLNKILAILLFCQSFAFAQNVKVTGKVTSSANEPIPAVSVKISGTSHGTSTDAEGNYSLSAPPNASLTFTSIGFVSQTVSINGKTFIHVVLEADSRSLDAVVVTALGIERSSKELTYSTTKVSAADLNQVKGSNVLNSLAGKAPGVFVTQGSGGPGTSPRIVLRGNKSITGDNQPLYVVDGVPMRFSDFNPEDIESLQVLQGASAAALYGSDAANGVILITTKKGKFGRTSVEFSSTATFENPLVLPELQTAYGQGLQGAAVTGVNDSWGPRITNGSDNHIRDFFRTGKNYINSLAISSGNETQRVYLSYANTDAQSMVPNYDYQRHNFNLRGSTQLFNNKITVDGGINYIKTKSQNQNASQWYNSPMFGLYLFPMGDDMSKYSANGGGVWSDTRNMYVQNWPYIKNEHSSNQNPYWIQERLQRDDLVDRTIFNLNAKWNITNWLNVSARGTLNRTQQDNEGRFAATSDLTSIGANGAYTKDVTNSESSYFDLLLNGTRAISKDISLNATLGFVHNEYTNRGVYAGTDGANTTLAYPNYFSIYGLTGNFISTETLREGMSQAVLGTATIGLKEALFLDLSARNEWSSTVDDPFFYPSAGLSYILTESIGSNNILSFAKIRASYAEVGNGLPFGAASTSPNYSLNPAENINGRDALPFFNGTDTISLKPERTRSYEIGTDLRFFKDKLDVSFTYYDATTVDQVFQIAAPSGAGAANFWINGGTIQNRGVEVAASYNAQFGKVSWNPSVNFSRNTNRIKELSDLLTTDRFVLQSANRLTNLYLLRPGSALLNGRKYGSFHDLFGKTYQYNEDGTQKFDEVTGLPVLSPVADQYLGNANPDFLLNFNNSFRYKNLSFSFLIDGRFGGLVSSSTEQWLDYKGLSKRTGEARDAGGVMLNGKMIPAETYYGYISAKADAGAAAEEYVFDSTNIRLRELAIGFTLPKFSNTLKNVNISLVGRNLFFLHKEAPFDPELAIGTGNANQGFEAFQTPSARTFGMSVKVGL